MFRQGDVLVVPVSAIPQDVTPIPRENGRVILAHGEVTGHAHAFAEDGVEMLMSNGVEFLKVDRVSELMHEEHHTIEFAPGAFKIVHQREYTPEALRPVAD